MLCRDVVDQLLNQDCLANARAAKQPDFTALLVWAEQIHDLNSRLKHLLRR